MKIVIADTFWKSLMKIARQETWWYKTYEVFRYKIPMFIENMWYFRKELWEFRSWDYHFNLMMFSRSLEKTANTIEYYGHEVDESRLKKVRKIKRAIHIISCLREDDYIERAEKEIGKLKNLGGWLNDIEDTDQEKEHNRKVFAFAKEIEDYEWYEFINILKGQSPDDWDKFYNSLTEEEKKREDYWYKWFDGSGMKGWWD